MKLRETDAVGKAKGTVEIERARLKVVGVPCATCMVPIRKTLEKVNGVRSVGANYITDLILVDYDPKVTSETEIVGLIKKVGYDSIPMH